MECRFVVEAKTFSFSVISGKAMLRLEEKRKRFGGFILLGGKSSVWLADMVEEATGVPKKGEFARSISDEGRVLKIRLGSNRAGCFLEAAVFVEGERKGVIRLPEGRGGWGWRRFAEELRPLSALLVEKVLPAVGNAGVEGKTPSYAEVLAAPLGGLKPACGEALASDWGRWFSSVGASCLTELLSRLATTFLAKVRAEVDRILFFGLGLKLNATRDVRKSLGRALSYLGLQFKLILGRRKIKRKACGLVLRPKTLVLNSRVKPVVRIQEPSRQGESLSTKKLSPAESVAAPMGNMSPAKRGFLRPGLSPSTEEAAVLSPSHAESCSSGESGSIVLESPVVSSTILTAQSLPARLDVGSVLMGCTQIVPETSLIPVPMVSVNLMLPELAQTSAPVGSSILPEQSGLDDFSTGSVLAVPEAQLLANGLSELSSESSLSVMESELAMGIPVLESVADGSDEISVLPAFSPTSSASLPSPKPSGVIDAQVLPIPVPQLLINGLTESQAWFLGWMRENTRCHEVLAGIDSIEVQTRRKNEVAPPPVCSMELSQLKAKLEAGFWDC
jgi:hypothetical protein